MTSNEAEPDNSHITTDKTIGETMLKIIAAAALSLALSSCVTPYQPAGLRGGFQESRLSPDTVNINFTGNAYLGKATAGDYALVRAAELALQTGYSHFLILNGNTESRASGAFTQGSGWSAFTNYSYKPEAGLSVRFFRGQQIPDGAIPARYMLRQMISKYPDIGHKLQVALGDSGQAENEAAIATSNPPQATAPSINTSTSAAPGCLENQAAARGVDAGRFSSWLQKLPGPELSSRQASCAAGDKESILRSLNYFLAGQ